MAIHVVTGTPGSGKSYSLTYLGRVAHKRGKHVFTSYPIELEPGLTSYEVPGPEFLREGVPRNSLVLLDEIVEWYDSRSWSEFTPEDTRFFTKHRHLGIDLVLGVIHSSFIDKRIRTTCEAYWWSRQYPYFIHQTAYLTVDDMETLNKEKSWRVRLLPRLQSVYRAYDPTGERWEVKEQDYKRWDFTPPEPPMPLSWMPWNMPEEEEPPARGREALPLIVPGRAAASQAKAGSLPRRGLDALRRAGPG